MAIKMASLRRAPNGDWFSRRDIPKDITAAYRAAYGVSQEARFRCPSSASPDRAKREFREWDAEVSSRIERLRAVASGEGVTLTQREAHALAGEWYVWFVRQHEEEPGEPEHWDIRVEEFERAADQFEDPTSPPARRHARLALTRIGRVEEFLGERHVALSGDAKAALLDTLPIPRKPPGCNGIMPPGIPE
jgi:hypothetical protein